MFPLIPPPRGPLRVLAYVTFADALGTGLFLTGAVVYATRALNFSAAFTGAALSIAAFCGVACAIPLGHLIDRLSPRRVLLATFGLRAALFAIVPLCHEAVAFAVVLSLVMIAETAARPAQMVLLYRSSKVGEHVQARAHNRSFFNAGAAIGALLASVPLAIDRPCALQLLVAGNVASFVGALALSFRLKEIDVLAISQKAEAPQGADRSGSRFPLLNPRFALLAVSSGVTLGAVNGIVEVGLPLQLTQKTLAPTWILSLLFLINTVLAIGLQVRASRGVNTTRDGSFANARAAVLLTTACVGLALSSAVPPAWAAPVLIVTMLFLTSSELLGSAAAWAMAYGLAPDNRQGEYIASFNVIGQTVQVAMPALTALLVISGGPAWYVLGVAVLVTGLLGLIGAHHQHPPLSPLPRNQHHQTKGTDHA